MPVGSEAAFLLIMHCYSDFYLSIHCSNVERLNSTSDFFFSISCNNLPSVLKQGIQRITEKRDICCVDKRN